MSLRPEPDHLVIFAASLDEGVAWCEATLGITPGPGGAHPLMGTHNRLFSIATAQFPRAYAEIIAIDNEAIPARAAPLKRWFDLDSAALRERVAQHGPQLIHWVANVPDLTDALAKLAAQGIDRGPSIAASRPTPRGLLEWQISVRDDGQRLFDGCLPTLIQWGSVHPAQHMPASGVTLQGIQLQHPEATRLQAAFDVLGLQHIQIQTGPAQLTTMLHTPRGDVRLASHLT
ncbi:VOC family protein [Variovorax sp. HJSM1_2]|uniref:VOC family protein n=1 Tax=Variovorax sp. HJSM1_2 TaxID=3366263 RepID=UPI003BE5B238